MKIGQKLSAGLLGIVSLLAMAGGFGLIGSGKIIHSYRELNKQFGPTASLTVDLDTALHNVQRQLLLFSMIGSPTDRRALRDSTEKLRVLLEKFQDREKDEKHAKLFDEIVEKSKTFVSLADDFSQHTLAVGQRQQAPGDRSQHLRKVILIGAEIQQLLGSISSYQTEQRMLLTARELGGLAKDLETHVHRYLALNENESKAAYFNKVERATKEVIYLQGLTGADQTGRLAERIAQHLKTAKSLGKYLMETASDAANNGRPFDALKSERSIQEFNRATQTLQSDLQALIQLSIQSFVKAREDEISEARAIQWTIIVVMTLAITCALVFSYILTHLVSTPLRKLQDAVRLYGQGKLDAKIPINSNDELGELAASFNRMADNLRDTMVSRSFVADIIESLPDTLLVVKPDLTIKMVNRATLNLLGFTKSQLVGQPVNEIFAVDCPFHQATPSSFARRQTSGSEATYQTKGKRRIPVLFSISPVIGDNDIVQEFVCIGKDITELKQAERKLKRSLKALSDIRFALDQSAILAVTDAEGTISNVNEKYCSLLNMDRSELIGRKGGLIDRDLHPPEYIEKLWKKISLGKLWRGDTKLKGKGGKVFWTNTTIVPFLDDNDKPFQYLAIQFDVTERKAAETELKRAKRTAEEHNRSKSQFLAKMSHELRTPLNAILGYCELLQEELEETAEVEAVADLDKIHAAGTHLLTIINDILDLSKIEAGKMEVFLERFEIAGMLRQVITTIKPVIDRNSNRLVVAENLETLGKMNSDFVKVKQVLINLLSNAAKFTNKGAIILTTQLLSKDGRDYIQFAVKDSGIGMSAEQVENIFEAFTQGDSSTTRKYGGTGLGLAITMKFCEMLGGSIHVTSSVGEGSTFTVTLPLDSEPLVDVEQIAQAAAN